LTDRESKERSSASDTKVGKRWTSALIVISAALAATWYLINIPYDVWTKILGRKSSQSEIQTDTTARGGQQANSNQTGTQSRSSIDQRTSQKKDGSGNGSVRSNPYTNPAVTKQEDTRQAAILIWQAENGKPQPAIEAVLADIILDDSIQPVRSFFSFEFIRDGKAQRLMAGDLEVVANMELGRQIDYVLIGESKVSYELNARFDGLLRANIALELRCLDAVRSTICGTQSITAPGAGYSQEAAFATAVDHLKPQLGAFIGRAIH